MGNLRDIAKRAGVSIGTTSGVLNGARNFAESTRRRVLTAAAELGYTPNLIARRISRAPGFGDRPSTNILAHVTHLTEVDSVDPFVGTRSLLLAHRAAAKGYYVLPLFYDHKTAFACPPVQNGHVDGVLAGLPDLEVAQAVAHLAPLVLMDVPFPSELLADVPRVNFDIKYGMRALARHLAELGHRRVAMLTMNQDNPFCYSGVRCPVLRQACAAAGLELHESLSRDRQLLPATNDQVFNAFVAEAVPLIRAGEVTALLMVDDQYAIDLMIRLNAAGVRVPEEVSVTGFAETPLRALPSPVPLATVSYPWVSLLDTALDLLAAELSGRDHRQGEILLQPNLTPGASLAAASAPDPQRSRETPNASRRRIHHRAPRPTPEVMMS